MNYLLSRSNKVWQGTSAMHLPEEGERLLSVRTDELIILLKDGEVWRDTGVCIIHAG
jgi:hypothetical protein